MDLVRLMLKSGERFWLNYMQRSGMFPNLIERELLLHKKAYPKSIAVRSKLPLTSSQSQEKRSQIHSHV